MHPVPDTSSLSSAPPDEDTPGTDPLAVAWIGDAAVAQRFTARRAPRIHITELPPSGAAERLVSSDAIPDLVVVDAHAADDDPLSLVRIAGFEGLDLPVLLLVEPGRDSLRLSAERLAVCDVLVKTPDFVHQLLASFAQLRARHDLLAAYRTSHQAEERFRTILEQHPAVTCLVGPDGIVAAMNQAGLALARAPREQIVGMPFADLFASDARTQVSDLVARVCRSEPVHAELTLLRADGTTPRVDVQAVPLQRPDGYVALTTIREAVFAPLSTEASPFEAALMDERAAEWDAERARLEQALADTAQHAAAAQQRADDERRHLQQELQAAAERADAMAASLAQSEAGIRQLEERLRCDQEEHSALAAERDRLARELDEWRTRAAGDTDLVRMQAAREADEARQALEDRLDAVSRDRDAALADLHSARERIDDLQKAQAKLRSSAAEHATRHVERLLDDANARCQHLVEELNASREQTAAVHQRAAALHEELAASAKTLATLEPLRSAMTADHQLFNELRQQLVRSLADVDVRCQTIVDRQAAALTALDTLVR